MKVMRRGKFRGRSRFLDRRPTLSSAIPRERYVDDAGVERLGARNFQVQCDRCDCWVAPQDLWRNNKNQGRVCAACRDNPSILPVKDPVLSRFLRLTRKPRAGRLFDREVVRLLWKHAQSWRIRRAHTVRGLAGTREYRLQRDTNDKLGLYWGNELLTDNTIALEKKIRYVKSQEWRTTRLLLQRRIIHAVRRNTTPIPKSWRAVLLAGVVKGAAFDPAAVFWLLRRPDMLLPCKGAGTKSYERFKHVRLIAMAVARDAGNLAGLDSAGEVSGACTILRDRVLLGAGDLRDVRAVADRLLEGVKSEFDSEAALTLWHAADNHPEQALVHTFAHAHAMWCALGKTPLEALECLWKRVVGAALLDTVVRDYEKLLGLPGGFIWPDENAAEDATGQSAQAVIEPLDQPETPLPDFLEQYLRKRAPRHVRSARLDSDSAPMSGVDMFNAEAAENIDAVNELLNAQQEMKKAGII